MRTIKVICNHSGGIECDGCKHNTPHNKYTFYDNGVIATTATCTMKSGQVCSCAMEHMETGTVQCISMIDN